MCHIYVILTVRYAGLQAFGKVCVRACPDIAGVRGKQSSWCEGEKGIRMQLKCENA